MRLVMTHRNAPAQGKADPSVGAYSRAFPALDGPDVHHFGEPVALEPANLLSPDEKALLTWQSTWLDGHNFQRLRSAIADAVCLKHLAPVKSIRELNY